MTAPARTAPASAAAMPDQPRPVVQQVAEALVTSRADRTELALSPEELGRLRVVFTGPDRTHVTIWAERPETLDLVRRNADLLAQQLADAGIGGGSMEFRRDDRPEGWGMQARDTGTDGDGAAPAPTESLRLSPRVLSDRRLDIRI
ncbi:flagellar hook-length control protein FliK [Paracoccus aestuarii]|nr:flagellar hook-length control protein FliK [Paracoccus aestuarii]WCQ99499.1 flagellar hook-length control protein FliK [Paracoccus aestuarii]